MIATTVYTDGDPRRTGELMHQMVAQYKDDMLPYAHLSFWDVHEIIKNLPFRPDPLTIETLQRPRYTMEGSGLGGDCDDKAIALASWCELTGYPWRFVAVRRPDMPALHHVYPEVYIGNKWVHADPTYSFNTVGRPREEYAEYVYI
jgi:hypothetical protein